MVKKILSAIIAWKALAVAAALGAIWVLPFQTIYTPYADFGTKFPYWVEIWANFDGYHYLNIARHGYFGLEESFFPLYPLLIRSVFQTAHLPYIIAGLIVSHMGFILSLFLVWKLLILDKKKSLFPLILYLIIIYPTAMFYGAVYNDALFFLFATLSLYYMRKQCFFIACTIASLATLTRLNGLALLFPIGIEILFANSSSDQKSWNLKALTQQIRTLVSGSRQYQRLYPLLLPPLTFAGFLLYIQHLTGNWHRVFSAMSIWHQDKVVLPFVVLWRYIKIILYVPPDQLIFWVSLFELLAVFFYIGLLVYSWKKIRLSYWLFFAVSILIPALTGTFQGMPRYGLHLYPMYLSLGLLVAERGKWFSIVLLTLFFLLFIFFTCWFTRGFFVA